LLTETATQRDDLRNAIAASLADQAVFLVTRSPATWRRK
jgi:hypothetical protein